MLGNFWVIAAFVFFGGMGCCVSWWIVRLTAWSADYRTHQNTNFMVIRSIFLSEIFNICWAKLNIDESTIEGKKVYERFIPRILGFHPGYISRFVCPNTVFVAANVSPCLFPSIIILILANLWFSESLSLTWSSLFLSSFYLFFYPHFKTWGFHW